MKRTRSIVFYYKNVSVKMDAPVIRLIRDQFKVCIIKNYVKFRIWTKNILVLQYLYFLFLSNHRSRQTFRIFQDNLKNFSQRKKKKEKNARIVAWRKKVGERTAPFFAHRRNEGRQI